MLKNLSLILALLGIAVLSLILIYQSPISINSQEQISNLTDNHPVKLQGLVMEEKYQKENKILLLNNNIIVSCKNPCPYYLHQQIEVIGFYDAFYKRIEAKKIIPIN